MFLKQSTAVTVKIGPFVDSTDGNTEETALTISQADIRLSKNGGAFAQTNNATGATHDEKGWYGVPLDTTDTNTLGKLEVHVHETGALPVWRTFMVVSANVWDSLFGTDLLQVDAREWLGGTIATPSVTGVPEVDLTHVAGTAATATGGRPEVNTTHWAGAATATDDVALATAPTNFASLAIDASGNVAADVQEINGDATSADNLAKTTAVIGRGTVTTGANTTSIPTSAFSPSGAAADQFKGRIITFHVDTTTAALRGQATDITASSNSATPTFTVTALTSTPASGDTFSVT